MTDRTRPGSSDKSAAGPVRSGYAVLAGEYDRRWADYVRRSTEETLRRMTPFLHPCRKVLDLGCGTGEMLKKLREHDQSLILAGVDLSPDMLEQARRKLADDIHLHESPAESLPFDPGSFDVVVSVSVLHFSRAPQQVLFEAARVLRPGGLFVLTDWNRGWLPTRIMDLYLRITDPAHHRTLNPGALTRLLERTEFAIVSLDTCRIGAMWGLMTSIARKPVSPNRDLTRGA